MSLYYFYSDAIVKCITLLAPGTHAFIIVITVGRYTEENVINLYLIEMFGLKAGQFSIVLFIRADDLKTECIEDFVKSQDCANLSWLIRFCENRYLVFNNREKRGRTQVTLLVK